MLLESLERIAAQHLKEAPQKQAWNHFISMGLPTKTKESFRYISLQELYETKFYESKLCESKLYEPQFSQDESYRFVFVDGVFSKILSSIETLPTAVVFSTIKEAARSYSSLLKGRFSKFLKEDQNAFSFLNYALFEEGFFLYIPPKVHLEKKIEIIELYSSVSPRAIFPKISIYLGKDAAASFYIKSEAKTSSQHFINRCIEFHAEAQSICRVENLLLDMSSPWYFDHVTAYLKRDASFSYISRDLGGKLLRQEFRVNLLEENSEVFLKGLSILEGKDQSHHEACIQHLAKGCRSQQHFKGVMFDRSKLSFEGKIWVDKIAQQTQAYQRSNHLLLGESAAAYSKPNLEIFADDVKASHGATVAQLSEEEIFYLQARGLEPSLAKKLLVKGFCKELMEGMESSSKEKMLMRLQSGLDTYASR